MKTSLSLLFLGLLTAGWGSSATEEEVMQDRARIRAEQAIASLEASHTYMFCFTRPTGSDPGAFLTLVTTEISKEYSIEIASLTSSLLGTRGGKKSSADTCVAINGKRKEP